MNRLFKVLDWFRLLDEDGVLSLSNLAVIVMLVKIAMLKTFSMSDAALLLPVMGNYTYKRYRQHKTSEKQMIESPANVSVINDRINRIEMIMNLKGMK